MMKIIFVVAFLFLTFLLYKIITLYGDFKISGDELSRDEYGHFKIDLKVAKKWTVISGVMYLKDAPNLSEHEISLEFFNSKGEVVYNRTENCSALDASQSTSDGEGLFLPINKRIVRPDYLTVKIDPEVEIDNITILYERLWW